MKKLSAIIFVVVCLCCLTIAEIGDVYAQSASLEDISDIIDNDTAGQAGVEHTLYFTLPDSALSIDFTDYIQIQYPNNANLTVADTIVGTYTGTPTYTLDGNTIKITGIFVLAGQNLAISGMTATNPPLTEPATVIVSVTTNEAGTLIKNYGTTVSTTNPGTVSMSAEVDTPQATIRITGFSGPETFVSFTEGENVIGTDLTSQLGVFTKVFPALTPGNHEISLYGVDPSNRATSIVPLSINAPVFQTTTVSNILLSPTIEINSNEINQGDPLYATGSAYPGTTVTIFTDIPLRTYTASASATGEWTTTISNTASYTPGDYRLYGIAQTPSALQSVASQKLTFSILGSSGSGSGSACGDISDGDLNCDGTIDLTDFSILMYYWASNDATADIDESGVVNLTDFSILMYYWGT